MTDHARPLRVVPDPDDEQRVAELELRAQQSVASARAELPELDTAAFDCYLGSLVRHIAATSEGDPANILASLIAACGVHLGTGPHLQVGDDRHPLLVWPLIIGRTGGGRKGAGWNSAKRLLRAADEEFIGNNVRSGLTSGEGLAAALADRARDPDDDTAPPETSDHRLLAFEPEWAGVMSRMKRDGNSLSATLRAAWEGGDLSTMGVQARTAKNTHVGILAHITPKEFRAKLSDSDMAGGTYNRFLPIAVARSQFNPLGQGAQPSVIHGLGTDLAAHLERGARLGTLGFTGAGATLWRELYIELGNDTGEDGPVEQFISRAAPNCLRIAAIHAALDGADALHPEHLTPAAALVRYSIASARAVFTDTTTPHRLAAWIAEAGPDGRTRKDITTGFFKGKEKADVISTILDQLIQAERITRTTRPRADGRPGRGAEIYTAQTTSTRT